MVTVIGDEIEFEEVIDISKLILGAGMKRDFSEEDTEPVEVWIESISFNGLMEIRWSHPVLTLKDLSLITEEVYKIELI